MDPDSLRMVGGQPNGFQRLAAAAVCEVLAKHGVELPPLQLRTGKHLSHFVSFFRFQERIWKFEIYDQPVIYVTVDGPGGGRWDSDAFGRNPPGDSERIADFAGRVDRLLCGEPWYRPEEGTRLGKLVGRLLKKVGERLRRRESSKT